jgi:hypothetical protein
LKTILVASVKDEGPYIIEWLAFHKALGFNCISILQNDSTDFTAEILTRLDNLGEISYTKNVGGGSPQIRGYRTVAKQSIYKQADWCLCLDIDEYFVPKQDATVDEFLNKYHEYDAIAINWLNFGSSNHFTWNPGFTVQRFIKCAEIYNKNNFHFKSFHRPDGPFSGFGIHRPWADSPTNSFIYTDHHIVEDNIQMGNIPDIGPNISHRQNIASIHHYSIRSLEEYLRKKKRGHGYFLNRNYGSDDHFKKLDTNNIVNTSALIFQEKFREEFFKLISDEKLSNLYWKSCACHFG